MIIRNLMDTIGAPVFVQAPDIVHARLQLYLKIEGLNAAGSIKLKPALYMVEELERVGGLAPGMGLIETTSGNMGVALAQVTRQRGYRFVCLTDEKMTVRHRTLIRTYGGELLTMAHSTLDQRYERMAQLMREDPSLICTRQFTNPANPEAHCCTTAKEIEESGLDADYVFVGVGTGGTLAGCSKRFESMPRAPRLVGVDTEGSYHFTSTPAGVRRLLPGIGSTKRSPFLDAARIWRVQIVSEREAVTACHRLRDATGWLLGASSGSVVAAAMRMQDELADGARVVTVCADMGERYLDTVYDAEWLTAHYTSGPAPELAHSSALANEDS